MRIITTGRTDLDEYFRLSGIRESKKLNHTPFLVFIEGADVVAVSIVDSARALLEFPDATKVMAQWSGQWRSDFFQFTVGDLREYIRNNPPETYHKV